MDKQIHFIKKLIALYPISYQKRFKEAQLEVIESYIDEHGWNMRTFFFVCSDILMSVFQQYIDSYISYIASPHMKEIKKFFIISLLFLAASVVPVIILTLIQYSMHNLVLLTKLNKPIVIFSILFVFPMISLLASGIGLIKSAQVSWKISFLGTYIVQTLPVMSAFIVSAGLLVAYTLLFFFHDSTHCILLIPQGIRIFRTCALAG